MRAPRLLLLLAILPFAGASGHEAGLSRSASCGEGCVLSLTVNATVEMCDAATCTLRLRVSSEAVREAAGALVLRVGADAAGESAAPGACAGLDVGMVPLAPQGCRDACNEAAVGVRVACAGERAFVLPVTEDACGDVQVSARLSGGPGVAGATSIRASACRMDGATFARLSTEW